VSYKYSPKKHQSGGFFDKTDPDYQKTCKTSPAAHIQQEMSGFFKEQGMRNDIIFE